jgi:uncharacterized protein (TIGR02145 family)
MKILRINLICLTLAFTFLVGCTKEDNPVEEPEVTENTVKDVDGNIYTTVTIGTQVWMVENLKTTKYRNGDPIPNVIDETEWIQLTTGGQSNYNNDAAIANKYGKLYNWFAVNDSRNIAPIGWHIPTKVEWETLINYAKANAGTSGSEVKALSANSDWKSSHVIGSPGNDILQNNSLAFSAIPGGFHSVSYGYTSIGGVGFFWSSSINENRAYNLKFYWGQRYFGLSTDSKNMGASVRCIKD